MNFAKINENNRKRREASKRLGAGYLIPSDVEDLIGVWGAEISAHNRAAAHYRRDDDNEQAYGNIMAAEAYEKCINRLRKTLTVREIEQEIEAQKEEDKREASSDGMRGVADLALGSNE